MRWRIKSGMLMTAVAVLSLSIMSGCAGREFAPKDPYPYWYYHKELPEADKAVAKAREAGKDKECPEEFAAAEVLKDNAYKTYAACKTKEAIAMAKEATEKATALCPPKPRPEPKPEPKPELKPGQAPEPRPEPAPARVIDRMILHVNFDFDKYRIRKPDLARLREAVEFIRKYPGSRIILEGHTDGIGTEKYNQKLSEKRAEAVRQYFIKEGAVDKAVISATGYGKSRPIASNNTKDGRAKNRRVEILIISDKPL